MTIDYLSALESKWGEVVKQSAKLNQQVSALLATSHPISVTPINNYFLVVIETRFDSYRTSMLELPGRLVIQETIGKLLGRAVLIDVNIKSSQTGKNVSAGRRITPQVARSKARGGGTGKVTSIRTPGPDGILFRSKLEHSTYCLLERANIAWEYEQEGFSLPREGYPNLWYQPDFWLPDLKTILEVKGILDANATDKGERMAAAAAERGITYMILQRLRPRDVFGLPNRYIAGTLVVADGTMIDAGIILARCPDCRKGVWKVPGETVCKLCGAKSRAELYTPII